MSNNVVEGRLPNVVEGRLPNVVEGRLPNVVEGRLPNVVEGKPPSVTHTNSASPACDFPDTSSTMIFAETNEKLDSSIYSATSAHSNIKRVLKEIDPLSTRVKGSIIDHANGIEETLKYLKDDLCVLIKNKLLGIKTTKDVGESMGTKPAKKLNESSTVTYSDPKPTAVKVSLDADGISMLSKKVNNLSMTVNDIDSNAGSLNDKINTLPTIVNETLGMGSHGIYNMIDKILADVEKVLANPNYVPQAGGRTRGLKRKSKARTHRKNRR
jgi:hypothetical protein